MPGTQRTLSAEDTYHRVLGEARALGVTRLADITGLDRIGIPTYSAIVPRSADIISVYTGKGFSRTDAKVGALMEAIERQTALRARPPVLMGSLKDFEKSCCILDPKDTKDELLPDYSDNAAYAWVSGRELISGSEILVPARMAGYVWDHIPPGPFVRFASTNGLASGNVLEEAICHGLCELIERDAWTLADMGARLIPWVRRRMIVPEAQSFGEDDFEIFPTLEVEDGQIMEPFLRAGLKPVLHDITSDLGVPTVYASVLDESFPGIPMVHGGLGTHPDRRVALIRALTEVAQSRCVDIQGVREDLCPPNSPLTCFNAHTRRISAVDRGAWTINESSAPRTFSELPTAVHDDVSDDIAWLLSRLCVRGITQVIVVDLASIDAPFSVVRVIAPELETWSVNHARLGRRAQLYWQAHV